MTGPDVQYTVIADDKSLREQAVAAIRQLDACGMNCGSAGNLSLRWSEGVLITPPAWGAADQRPRDMVWLGHDDTLHREWQPSSEWHFHRAIYQA